MKRDGDETTEAGEGVGGREMSEAEIDENLDGSFPASDPPAWTLGSNHNSDVKPRVESDESGDE